MANTIRIARSVSTNTPSSLAQGELANSETGSPNGINELFIGEAGPGVFKLVTNTGGNPAEPNSSSQDNQTLTTGTGIDGADGGSSGNFTISLALDELSVTSMATGDWIAFDDAGVSNKALISAINLSLFNNDAFVESVTASTGVTVAGTATDPTVALDYLGTDNFIDSATDLESTAIATADTIIYHDATDDNIKKGLISDLPFGSGSGDISRVDITAGTGLTGDLNTVSGDHIQTINAIGGVGITANANDLALDLSELGATTMTGADWIAYDDAGTSAKALISGINLGIFDNATSEFVSENDTIVVADWNWVLDEDAMGSDSNVHVPTQQSVKAYVDSQVVGALTHKGGYNASTNTPALDTGTPTLVLGDMYTVTVAGTFFTVELEIGDVLISDVDSTDAAALADWTIVQTNLEAATETNAGFVELATQAEMDTGTDDARAVTPLKYANSIIDGGTF